MGSPRLRQSVAALLLSALALAALPALGVTSPAAPAGVCQACESCENGSCDESSPLEPGDHCCLSSCLAHSLWVFSVPSPALPSQQAEATVQHDSSSPLQAAPQGVYQPPRR